MKKTALPLFLILALLCACAPTAPGAGLPASSSETADAPLTVLATTYPLYLFARSLTQGVDAVEVHRLNTTGLSCLHDYTLSMSDMQLVEKADLLLTNGGGLEEFMSAALTAATGTVINCTEGLALLEAQGHDDHAEAEEDHGHFDPHVWLDCNASLTLVSSIYQGLTAADPNNAETYRWNYDLLCAQLEDWDTQVRSILYSGIEDDTNWQLITFHDGFEYFAQAYGLTILKAVEEEEGSTASAKDMEEIISLIRAHSIPAVFVEKNGPVSTANTIALETGTQVFVLDMIMDGEDGDAELYHQAMLQNAAAIRLAFTGEEVQPTL